jgi:geranylgeranyl pyrophosphate synthase
MLDKYVNEAVGALAVLPDSYEKKCLEELAFYTADRKK